MKVTKLVLLALAILGHFVIADDDVDGEAPENLDVPPPSVETTTEVVEELEDSEDVDEDGNPIKVRTKTTTTTTTTKSSASTTVAAKTGDDKQQTTTGLSTA